MFFISLNKNYLRSLKFALEQTTHTAKQTTYIHIHVCMCVYVCMCVFVRDCEMHFQVPCFLPLALETDKYLLCLFAMCDFFSLSEQLHFDVVTNAHFFDFAIHI